MSLVLIVFILFFLDLKLVLSLSTFVCCSFVQDHLQRTLEHIGELLIPIVSIDSTQILYFI